MNISEIKTRILRNLSNVPGWRTKRKILVIESDDWGSIRMPSREVFNQLKENGINVTGGDTRRYNLNDTLASSKDLIKLFDLLLSFKDIHNHPCAFTAVSLVANPDFQKIRENDFHSYHYEPFTDTLEKYYPRSNTFELWKEGITSEVFIPQFHGREHLHISNWMRALQGNNRDTRMAFDLGMWSLIPKQDHRTNVTYQAAFDLYYPEDLVIQETVIREGLELFHHLFGYKATFFVPPNGPFNKKLEEVSADCGVKYISASKIQKEPMGLGKTNINLHWLGQKNKYHKHYMIRNCFFEPNQQGRDWVNTCLKEIEIAFRWQKPAIISSHRVNYIGTLDTKNRENGLQMLKTLLERVQKKYPELEFMTSNQLGDMIARGS